MRVAMVSLHTSPLDPPGSGDSGGMNVYVRSVASRLAAGGIDVDVFTRCRGRGVPDIESVAPGLRVIQAQAGPCGPVPKESLPQLLPDFIESVARHGRGYDLVHAHYWLSGAAGAALAARWAVPLVVSFHTLGEVKRRAAGASEPEARLRGERLVIAAADRILAPTSVEVGHLVDLYDADPGKVRLVPPGVDPARFAPGDGRAARRALGLGDEPVALFVGRLQPVKGPDLAIRAVAEVQRRGTPMSLVVAGGPSGASGRLAGLMDLAAVEGISRSTRFIPPVPHERLAPLYRAADVLLVPSRSESFGLAALEAQACGTPVIAAGVGGLPHVVEDGGLVVERAEPGAWADEILRVVRDPVLARRLSEAGAAGARRRSWKETTHKVREVYSEVAAAEEATMLAHPRG